MISYLKGNVLGIDEDRVLLEVQGVGYEIAVPLSLLQKLSAAGGEIELFTHLHVREDLLQLYGFPTLQDRAMFRALLKARGIGPKVALTIVDTFRGKDLAAILERGEVEPLLQVPGVGKKTAQRLILELKGKLPEPLSPIKDSEKGYGDPVYDEVAQALLSLGYSRQEVGGVLQKLPPQIPEGASVGEVLRLSLRELGKKV
ncbi:Holliday junction branch migration protein RuvA [Syntrophaceticus schinkii]|uniref:Holliday junction branch migration complex subunit RuvA n=1 Tax=Syntrophaceticus schinkii TaxID=499207 RepID=A0A0B7MG60_9FIRM|nr:Holliday junction branch migration protein RuvA [Syntrophaceticus schinkii]MDD2359943.1 Holliday junction branch migration protein RuvA [Syntrophaceticus schinkii]MDD4260700.1 Holliday junction branch migration protein RuvA [Syntrophaceticus schinkii]MDD4674379.1 Holliday junction branch migration protein RuvA [Syntrophaceticus schinkii]CEO89604.1 Holliday junction ATP-dependent DNA helicase RuvA [Syntrophaceticus schinkii]